MEKITFRLMEKRGATLNYTLEATFADERSVKNALLALEENGLKKTNYKLQGTTLSLHSEKEEWIAYYEIVNCNGGEIMDQNDSVEKALNEAYNLKQVPVGEIFESSEVAGQKNDNEAQLFEDENTIPIPAHMINEEGYIDPNIGYGNYDLLKTEFASEELLEELEELEGNQSNQV